VSHRIRRFRADVWNSPHSHIGGRMKSFFDSNIPSIAWDRRTEGSASREPAVQIRAPEMMENEAWFASCCVKNRIANVRDVYEAECEPLIMILTHRRWLCGESFPVPPPRCRYCRQ